MAKTKDGAEKTLIETARRTLEHNRNAALATVTPDGQPWNSPVFVAIDDDTSIYWMSTVASVHSTNIAGNAKVMIAIFDSSAPDETGHGLYIRAVARALTDEGAIRAGLTCLAKRRHETPKSPTEFMGHHPQRVYRAIPETVWTNVVHHDGTSYVDEPTCIDLAQLLRDAAQE